jgi:release factor glutamine methyltransferase
VPTAYWNDYSFDVPEGVYFPAEDTYLLLDYLTPLVSAEIPAGICEIGCGSGIVGISLLRESPVSRGTLVDIDTLAVETTRKNADTNGINDRVDIFESNLFDNVPAEAHFDWIIFNPPYLPASGDLESPAVQIQTEGGPSGLRVTRQFLAQVARFLNDRGKVFFIASSLSPLKFLARLCKGYHSILEPRRVKHAFFEDIILYEQEFP